MFSGWNNIFKLTVTGILIFLLGSQIAKHQSNLLALREISAGQFFLIAGIVIASLLINGSKLKVLAGSYNIQLNPSEIIGLSSITTSLNNFFFKAGSLFTSNYLKQRHEFPFMSFAGTQGADHLILFFINALCGLTISLALVFEEKEIFLPLVICYFSAAVFLILVFSKTFNFQHRSNKFLNALIRAINSLYRIIKNKKLFSLLCAHNMLLVGLSALRLLLVCKALNIEISFGYCLLFITLTPVISAIPIIHSDLGTRELAIGMYSQWLGMGFQTGMLATLLDRCFVLFWAILISLYYRSLFFSTKATHTPKN
ncbi:flippase-like domain-containing protein [bacterium AH-315-C08]|nr:flippase-like domain-containing protein [bacterium AH-315-C08]